MASSIPPDSTGSESPGGEPDLGRPIATVDPLPPVEPPSARFIIQLFVIPAVIVAAVVMLWLVINWLASPGQQDPDAIIHGLRSSSQTRFQQAEELAGMLRMEQSYPELKTSRELAVGLGELLGEQVAEAEDEPEEDSESAIRMRMFLCASLGEFHVDEPLPWLLIAARDDPNGHVRRRAIGAAAVLAGWFAAQEPPRSLADPDLVPVLAEMADSQEALDRSAAAFTLGVFAAGPDADPEMRELLAELVGDFYFDARYNAATGLARVGDLRSVPVLAEMLDLEQITASIESEQAVNPKLPGSSPPGDVVLRLRADKRDKLIKNGLVGVDMLLEHYAPTDLPQLGAALRELNTRVAEVRDLGPIPKTLQGAVAQMAERFE